MGARARNSQLWGSRVAVVVVAQTISNALKHVSANRYKVKVQGPVRLKLDLETWQRLRSRPLQSSSFSSYLLKCQKWCHMV